MRRFILLVLFWMVIFGVLSCTSQIVEPEKQPTQKVVKVHDQGGAR